MNIHEYQAKEILSRFGVSIPKGGVAYSPENAKDRATELGGDLWVVKAQIHSGARGKAGGIIVCKSEQEVSDAANKLLGKTLVTHQTGPEGKTVQRIYVEEGTDIKKEFYLSCLVDRASSKIAFISSAEGGMDIEKVATGEVWFGTRAAELALIDEIKTSDEYLTEQVKQADVYEISYVQKKKLHQRLGMAAEQSADRLLLKWWNRLTGSSNKYL